MTYFEQLYPWCIIKPVADVQWRVLARFRRRNDAEAHLQVLRRLIPDVSYQIIFDVKLEKEENHPEQPKILEKV
ncbi:MAG: hypothetical protein WA865_16165 [Spirulinaceae cyanobacterium]